MNGNMGENRRHMHGMGSCCGGNDCGCMQWRDSESGHGAEGIKEYKESLEQEIMDLEKELKRVKENKAKTGK